MTQEEILFFVGQIIGGIATVFSVLSFQTKSRLRLLVVQTVGSALWSIHFIMIGEPTGSVLNLVSIVRNLVYSKKKDWRWARSCITPAVISVLSVALSFLTYKNLFSLLPMLATVLSTIAFFLDDEKTIRIICLFVSLGWIIYNINALSIPGIFTEAFNLTSIVIALIRFRKRYAMIRAEAAAGKSSEKVQKNE